MSEEQSTSIMLSPVSDWWADLIQILAIRPISIADVIELKIKDTVYHV